MVNKSNFSVFGGSHNVKRKKNIAIGLNGNFSDSELFIICSSLLPQTSVCLKFRYKKACQVLYQKDFWFSQKTKFGECLSFRITSVLIKRQPDFANTRKIHCNTLSNASVRHFELISADHTVCGRIFSYFYSLSIVLLIGC